MNKASEKRLRVLVLTAYPAVGGPLPKVTPLLLQGLRACACDVAVEGWSAHHAGPEGLAAKISGRVVDLAKILRRAVRWRPDVVYVATSHGWPSLARDVPLTVMLRGVGLPVVLHLHGSEADRLGQPGQRLFTWISAWLARRTGAVLLLSSEEVGPWRRVCPGGRFEVVINPFVPSHCQAARTVESASSAGPTLLLVARLEPGKGIFDALDALEIACRRRPCRLVFAGSGPARDELARRVRDRGLGDVVDMPGYLSGSALSAAYQASDVFILPSYRKEGFPLSVMEAMGYGLPIVTTARRGCADILTAGEHALFVPPRDPQALAGAIDRLLDDDGLRERMGRANLEKVGDFAPERVVPRYAQILRQVVREDRRRGRAGAALSQPGTGSRP